jgi:TolB protein
MTDLTDSVRSRGFGRRGLLVASASMLAAPAVLRAQTLAPPAAPGSPPPASGRPGQSEITVDRARAAPIPIAIPPLGGGGGDSDRIASGIAAVVTNDLGHSGLFRPVDPAAFINAVPVTDVPNFQNWKAIGAQALVTGRVEPSGGRLRVEFRLWDVLPGQQIQGTAYTTDAGNWRRIGHIISDVIYERMLGEKGYFDTRIVYIAGSGPRDRRTRRLAIMDQDGENSRFLTEGAFAAHSPRFHPTRDEIAFMSYANNRPRVYLFDLGSGRQQSLGDFSGITLSPRFSPDGGTVIMAQTEGSGSAIVTVGLGGGGSRRLTDASSINVSPCYSPDGSQVVFNSDRGGDQQLYVMGAGGGGVRRISFGNGRYAAPVWSPRGDLIAFIRFNPSAFSLGVMRPDGSGERILSEGYYVDGPSFCPNGRVLTFWKETPARDSRGNGYSQHLYTIDIAGFNERALPTPLDGAEPAWSPLLQ